MAKEDLILQLEQFVDKHGLLHVITALDLMCTEKAAHIRASYQDEPLAKNWDRAANALYTASSKISDLGV